MASRRGRSQARRNQGPGIPGWAWLLAGLLLGIALILVVPGLLKSDGEDGFFRPQPNPDAQPIEASQEPGVAASPPAPVAIEEPAEPEYAFYTLLPGEEVALTDAQLAATARAEAQAVAAAKREQTADAQSAEPHVQTDPAEVTPAPTHASAGTADARYILQAGSFSTAGDAESLKARIALLGLVARVETAQIKGNTMYRVRMGPYGSASALSQAKRKLAANGLPALAIKAK